MSVEDSGAVRLAGGLKFSPFVGGFIDVFNDKLLEVDPTLLHTRNTGYNFFLTHGKH